MRYSIIQICVPLQNVYNFLWEDEQEYDIRSPQFTLWVFSPNTKTKLKSLNLAVLFNYVRNDVVISQFYSFYNMENIIQLWKHHNYLQKVSMEDVPVNKAKILLGSVFIINLFILLIYLSYIFRLCLKPAPNDTVYHTIYSLLDELLDYFRTVHRQCKVHLP